MKKLVIVLPLFLALGMAKQDDPLMQRAQAMFKPIPATPPALEDTPMTPETIELGKLLYFDPRLSRSWLISCNTCHNLGLGGVDLLQTSIGHGWQRGPRNAPTVLNAVFNIAQFWDGRAEDLEEQAKGPVQAAVEMNSTIDRAVATLKSIPEYVEWFGKAFPAEADPVTFDNMAKAIEAFEATLLTPGARFDQYLEGNSGALSAREKQGLRTFMDKGCVACHNGLNVGGAGYFPFGVVEKPGADILPREDKGRFAVTQTASDEYVFKAPSLRNVGLTPPYFHSGGVWDLEQAVGIMGAAQLGQRLSDVETEAIAAFLRTLTGEQPRVAYPVLPPQTGATPLPDVEVTLEGAENH
ncbi:MAG: cytochrome C peroxidase [Gemmatimonas sp. SM23_52]|nr:MAG: cytochrome C peroxidase [Gemmatimonas sp. SM23_52]